MILVDSTLICISCFFLIPFCAFRDLEHLGYEPIFIETPAGREEYVKEQLRLKLAGEPLRQELLETYKALKEFVLKNHKKLILEVTLKHKFMRLSLY